MPEPMNFFDDAARVGELILNSLGGMQNQSAAIYLERAGKIYRLMAQVHNEVAALAVRVGLSQNVGEARHALSRLDNERLSDVFRVMNWCDEFEWLGNELAPLADRLGLGANDRAVWSEFCQSLSLREGEVAYLYQEKLFSLRRLEDSSMPLEQLKTEVDGICRQLTTQKARFDLLAMKAEAMRRRLH